MSPAAKPLFFRETFDVLPGRGRDFVRLFRGDYSRGLARIGLGLVGLWRTSLLQGPGSDFIALWEYDSAEQMIQLSIALDSLDQGDVALQKARNDMSAVLAGREGWSLLGYDTTLSLRAIRDCGMSLQTCLYEEIDVVANQHEIFDKALRVNFLRMMKDSGLRLVGVYRPLLHSVEAVVLWNLDEGWDSFAHLDSIDGTPEWLHWHSVSQTFRRAFRGRVLEAV